MSRNGSGVYSLPAGSTVANGDTSDATDLNTPLADIEADLNVARPVVAGGTGSTSASGARTALGLAIGTDVQAFDAGLTSIAGLTTAADRMIYTTASDVYAVATLTAAGRAILDDADAAAQLVTLGAQASDLDLTAVAALGSTGIAVRTAANTWAQRQVTSASPALVVTNPAGVAGDISLAVGTTVGILTTTGATTVGPWALPAGVTRFTVTSNKSSLSGTNGILVQLRVGGTFVTAGYDSRSLQGTLTNQTSTAGMLIAGASAANYWDGAMDFWLHNPATNLWLCRHTGSVVDTAADMVLGSGSIALAGAVDGVRITVTGANTFDVSSFNVHY